MKKIFLALSLVFLSAFCFAQDDALEKLYSNAFEQDHADFKDAAKTMRIWKKLSKIFPGYYEEKNTFTPAPEDAANGLSVYLATTSQEVYPNSRPGKSDLVKEIASFGVPGEYVPTVLCVLPQADMKGISVSVSDLKGPGVIPSTAVSVCHVKYEYMPVGNYWFVKGRYLLKGPADGYKDVPRAFWITVKLPDNAAAGVYKGEVTVNAGKKPVKMPYSVEVFPIQFAQWNELNTFWMWYYNSYPENSALEKVLDNLREHGMNSFDSNNPFPMKVSGGSVTIDFKTAERVAPLLKKYGFTSWMIDNQIASEILTQIGGAPWSEQHKAALKEFSTQVAAKAKSSGWPKVVFTIDEPREDNESGNLRGWIDVSNIFTIVSNAGLTTNVSWTGGAGYGDSNTKRKDDKSKVCDYREVMQLPFFNTTHGNLAQCKMVVDKVHSLKKPLLLYNCGANRLAFGLTTWQEGALGNSQFWWGAAKLGDPTTEAADASCAVYNKDGQIVDTTNWEQIREGVYDFRYIMTLEKAIADCKTPGAPEVSSAKVLLSSMKGFTVSAGSGTGREADFMAEALKDFKGEKLDEFRYKMAKLITALQAVK